VTDATLDSMSRRRWLRREPATGR